MEIVWRGFHEVNAYGKVKGKGKWKAMLMKMEFGSSNIDGQPSDAENFLEVWCSDEGIDDDNSNRWILKPLDKIVRKIKYFQNVPNFECWKWLEGFCLFFTK